MTLDVREPTAEIALNILMLLSQVFNRSKKIHV
jgi:hypothetical protein